jgi:hypothetical protein
MTDFRALCAELAKQLEGWQCYASPDGPNAEVLARARAALAQPKPQGPTDEELDEFAIYWWGSETDERSVSDVIECGSMAAYAQAVLARWGRPAIEPVPVSERLPRPEDCDAEGRCWLTSVDVEPGWVTDNPEQCTNWTHWLPHWALPVPGVEGEP